MPLSARLHAVLSALVLVPALIVTVLVAARTDRGTTVLTASEHRPMATDADRAALQDDLDTFLAERRVAAAGADVVEAPDPAEGEPATVWDRLADCESGDWNADGVPVTGSARWEYGLTFDHGDIFEGGLNFHPRTWDAFRDPGMPDHAGHAGRGQQIEVGRRVLDAQGWGAWPVCSRKLGLR